MNFRDGFHSRESHSEPGEPEAESPPARVRGPDNEGSVCAHRAKTGAAAVPRQGSVSLTGGPQTDLKP